jgi:hypothetical protein
MLNRISALRLATALLYFGPLLAGLSGAGWAFLPIFVVLFVLWVLFLHPELSAAPEWLPLLERAAAQALLVAILFGVGRGLGGVNGLQVPLPVWLTVMFSVAAIFLGRIICNPAALPPDLPESPPVKDV